MSITGVTFDAEGVVLAWARSVPSLTGKGNPIGNGIHLGQLRSPQSGAIAGLSVGASTVDPEGLGHEAPITFEVRAIGSNDGARRQGAQAGRALAAACRRLTGAPVLVSLDGELVKISHARNVQGPLYAGNVGGEVTYRITAVFVLQDV